MLFISQWAESLFKELDYRREARNGIRFRELYGDLEVCICSVPLSYPTLHQQLITHWIKGLRMCTHSFTCSSGRRGAACGGCLCEVCNMVVCRPKYCARRPSEALGYQVSRQPGCV